MTFGCAWLKTMTQADFINVQYKGNGPALNDLMGGQVNILFDLFNTSLPQIRAGRIRAVALTGPKRGEPLPGVRRDRRVSPGFVLVGWHGVMAPVGLPRPVLDKLNQAFQRRAFRQGHREAHHRRVQRARADDAEEPSARS